MTRRTTGKQTHLGAHLGAQIVCVVSEMARKRCFRATFGTRPRHERCWVKCEQLGAASFCRWLRHCQCAECAFSVTCEFAKPLAPVGCFPPMRVFTRGLAVTALVSNRSLKYSVLLNSTPQDFRCPQSKPARTQSTPADRPFQSFSDQNADRKSRVRRVRMMSRQ